MPKYDKNDLYHKDNIIGYTGDLTDNPTIYFKKEHTNNKGIVDSVSFGHITQAHKYDFNLGREKVGKAKTYEIKNNGKKNDKGDITAQEYANGVMFHPSRNKFNDVSKNKAMKEQLSNVLDNYMEVKKRYIPEYVKGQVKDIIKIPDRKQQTEALKTLENQVNTTAQELKNYHSNRGLSNEKLQEKLDRVNKLQTDGLKIITMVSKKLDQKHQKKVDQQLQKDKQFKKKNTPQQPVGSSKRRMAFSTFEQAKMPMPLSEKMKQQQGQQKQQIKSKDNTLAIPQKDPNKNLKINSGHNVPAPPNKPNHNKEKFLTPQNVENKPILNSSTNKTNNKKNNQTQTNSKQRKGSLKFFGF